MDLGEISARSITGNAAIVTLPYSVGYQVMPQPQAVIVRHNRGKSLAQLLAASVLGHQD